MEDVTRLYASRSGHRSFAEAALSAIEGAQDEEMMSEKNGERFSFSPVSFGVVLGFHGFFGG